MNKKEREQLECLIDRVRKTTDLIHTLPGRTLLYELEVKKPFEIMELIIRHLDEFDIYLKYSRFDQEASVRDLSNLLRIIESLGGKRV